MTATWADLVTVALLGTDRRPLPGGLPPSWAGSGRPPGDPTYAVLDLAARHRAAVLAGSALPSGPAPELAPPPDHREPGSPQAQQELADALERGAPGPVNDALAVLVDQDTAPAAEHWAALATLAAGIPRVDRGLLARALGARGVWFVEQNPQWVRLAAALRHRRSEGTE